jgi:DNA-binding NarL/FixJ family response regulator
MRLGLFAGIRVNGGGMTRKNDWIALVEASYDLDASDQLWLDNLFDCAEPLLDPGMARVGWTFQCTPTTFELGSYPTRVPRMMQGLLRAAHAIAPQSWFDFTYRAGHVVGTGSELVAPRLPHVRPLPSRLTGGRAKDVFMTGAQSGTALGMAFGVWLREERSPTALERKRWPCVSAHLGAGLRLRLAARNLRLDAGPVEAVLDAQGKVHDARASAASPSARELLREAVRRIDKARTADGRADPDSALDSWTGLVDGRWSLVDRFDTDGRRFIVAIRNDPAHPDPRGLTMGEREVGEFVGLGRSTKEIGYILGVSYSAVTNMTSRAQAKLGLESRAELAAFFAPAGLRAKLAEVAVNGEQLLVGAYPLVDKRKVEKLTDAERAVVAHLVVGSTNNDIAHRRRTSESTVANQVHSIYTKLGVRSRAELAARLHEGKG